MSATQRRNRPTKTKSDAFDPPFATLDAEYAAFRKSVKRVRTRKHQAIAAKFQAAFERRRGEDIRAVNNVFHFWWVCPEKACKRTSRCAGDPRRCHERWWPVVPEGMKVEFRTFISASAKGLSDEQALHEVASVRERFAEQIAQAEAQQLADLRARDEKRALEQGVAPAADERAVTPPAEEPPARERARGPRVSVL